MNKKPFEVIKELESDNSKLFKAAIVKREAERKNDDLFAGFDLTFNPYITFGIAKIPIKKAGATGGGLTFKAFYDLVQQLITRKTTGHAARDLVQSMCDAATIDEWNGWYRRILDKDLRCGMTESTVNKVVYGDFVKKKWVAGIAPQYRIMVHECSLAKPADDHPNYMKGKKQIDTKMDGHRCNAFIDPKVGRVQLFSRNGIEFENYPHICAELLALAKAAKFTESMMIDGEVMSKSFQDLMRQARRKYDVTMSDAVFNVFDMITLAEFRIGQSKEKQKVRSAKLKKLIDDNQKILPSVTFLEYETIDLDTPKGRGRLEELRLIAAEAGAEGIMVKDPEAMYECSRTTNWLKIKPVITLDLKIVDVEIGEEGKKNANRLGAFVCEGVDLGKHIRVNVGSGFDEDQREAYWQSRKILIGQTVEVEADAVTKSEKGTFYSLRFPRFKSFRDDK